MAVGRGRNYSRKRAVAEKVMRVVYGDGWPGRVWGRLPGRTAVDLIEHRLPILPPSRVAASSVSSRSTRSLRVAFASDLHIGPLTSPATLDNAFALLAAARPDVLLLGGDYVFLEATPAMADELERRVAGVPAPVKLAVLGNHDLWTRHDLIEAALERAGAKVLVNRGLRLPPPFEDVAFIGLDDCWAGTADAGAALAPVSGAALTLALAHSPEALPLLVGRGLGFLWCGHTHGGQIALPSGPIVVHGPHGRRFPSGMNRMDDLPFFVSRGVGMVEVPFRAYARPDVSVFTLTAA